MQRRNYVFVIVFVGVVYLTVALVGQAERPSSSGIDWVALVPVSAAAIALIIGTFFTALTSYQGNKRAAAAEELRKKDAEEDRERAASAAAEGLKKAGEIHDEQKAIHTLVDGGMSKIQGDFAAVQEQNRVYRELIRALTAKEITGDQAVAGVVSVRDVEIVRQQAKIDLAQEPTKEVKAAQASTPTLPKE